MRPSFALVPEVRLKLVAHAQAGASSQLLRPFEGHAGLCECVNRRLLLLSQQAARLRATCRAWVLASCCLLLGLWSACSVTLLPTPRGCGLGQGGSAMLDCHISQLRIMFYMLTATAFMAELIHMKCMMMHVGQVETREGSRQ